ncbi:aspartyl-phosphate phosphatase Spo0E family protein [Halobacillus massiliensis]|uniref:aspartyl-phosphate phosphatase Spo0E family protein n=1 Tax=Halobacillus massiliensis TaxID=1926286 RepID=UPI0009E518D1|nr:aspartyl-phosphate phosphatase Spo0E family protein [Halobacillus massiliensis]
MDKNSELEKEIEQVRFKMYKCYLENPTDPCVIDVSTQLDTLLNKLDEEGK